MDPSSGNDSPGERWLSAAEASALLGVKRQTLYAYVSRGRVRSRASAGSRARSYLESDLRRLRAHTEARSGHGAVAAGALLFGEPVLDSAITRIEAGGPHYRGISALALARDGARFEQVRELLLTGDLPGGELPIEAGLSVPSVSRLAGLTPDDARPVDAALLALPAFSMRDPARFDDGEAASLRVARRIVRALTASLGLTVGADHVRRAVTARRLAESFAHAFGIRASKRSLALIDQTLILCADHELNASSFTCRVTASSGADLYACATAGLATLTGPRHGGMSARVGALCDEIGSPGRAIPVIRDRLRRGESIPGFGHRLYPEGDPRGPFLLEAARAASGNHPRVRILSELVDAQELVGGERPTLDVGLVAVAAALRLPRGGAMALFAAGRCAGWLAHALEQRASGLLLRPRARYVGQ